MASLIRLSPSSGLKGLRCATASGTGLTLSDCAPAACTRGPAKSSRTKNNSQQNVKTDEQDDNFLTTVINQHLHEKVSIVGRNEQNLDHFDTKHLKALVVVLQGFTQIKRASAHIRLCLRNLV